MAPRGRKPSKKKAEELQDSKEVNVEIASSGMPVVSDDNGYDIEEGHSPISAEAEEEHVEHGAKEADTEPSSVEDVVSDVVKESLTVPNDEPDPEPNDVPEKSEASEVCRLVNASGEIIIKYSDNSKKVVRK